MSSRTGLPGGIWTTNGPMPGRPGAATFPVVRAFLHRPAVALGLAWIAASAIGGMACAALAAVPEGTGGLLMAYFGSAALLAAAQWAVLREGVRVARWWVPVTVGGQALGGAGMMVVFVATGIVLSVGGAMPDTGSGLAGLPTPAVLAALTACGGGPVVAQW